MRISDWSSDVCSSDLVVLLFAFQAETIISNPLLIVLIAIPIIIQSYGIFAVASASAKEWKVPHAIAAPCALIGTANFFQLSVGVAIVLFGVPCGSAQAPEVGELVDIALWILGEGLPTPP